MEADPPGMNPAAPATAYEAAMQRLRAVRDAVNNLDLDTATHLLAEHDARLREALDAVPPQLATAEAEMLRNAQDELLVQLIAVQRGVSDNLQQARRGGAAARAYLGNAGG
jgi:hypothetical protein